MAQVAYKVEMIESERGWGSRVDERLYFIDEATAVNFTVTYNQRWNTETHTPDWYIVARYVGETSIADNVELISDIYKANWNLEG